MRSEDFEDTYDLIEALGGYPEDYDQFMPASETIDLLVYGTLRVGGHNDRGLTSSARQVVRNVTVRGSMNNVHGARPIYPVVDFDAAGQVVGDLLLDVDKNSWAFRDAYSMELGAGYVLRNLDVAMGPDGALYFGVYGFHYTYGQVGVPVPNGDWIAFCGERF